MSHRIVHLVRHGNVENPAGVIYGRLPNFHLSDRGRDEANEAARLLAGRPIGLVVTSPMERAVETALPIAAAHGLMPQVDARLLEVGTSFEGLTWKSLWRIVIGPARWRGRERHRELRTRMLIALRESSQRCPDREIVLVSHQGTILALRYALRGWSRAPLPSVLLECPTGSVTTILVGAHFLDGPGAPVPAREGA